MRNYANKIFVLELQNTKWYRKWCSFQEENIFPLLICISTHLQPIQESCKCSYWRITTECMVIQSIQQSVIKSMLKYFSSRISNKNTTTFVLAYWNSKKKKKNREKETDVVEKLCASFYSHLRLVNTEHVCIILSWWEFTTIRKYV